MIFDHPFVTSGSWTTKSARRLRELRHRLDPAIKAKVGISYVSVANAVLNRTTEDPGWNFTAVRRAAAKSWTSMLDKIQVGGGTTTQQTVFYTALYHSLLDPSVFSDPMASTWGLTARSTRSPHPRRLSTPTTRAGTSTGARYSSRPCSRRNRPATSSLRCSTITPRADSFPMGRGRRRDLHHGGRSRRQHHRRRLRLRGHRL